MIDKIYWSIIPYFDVKKGRNSYKRRPVLIIGDIRNDDYTVLPISKVSKKQYLDSVYDVEVKQVDYPNLKLTIHKSSQTDNCSQGYAER